MSGCPLGHLSEDDDHLAIYGVQMPSPPRTLIDILQHSIQTHPEVIAIESSYGTVTYGELEDILNEEASRLAELGIGCGSRVGIRVPSGTTDLYVAILATLWAGAAYVPVDWDDTDDRARTVWEEAGVDAVYGRDLTLTPMSSPSAAVERRFPGLDNDCWIIFTSGSTGKPKGVAITHRSAGAWVDAESRMFLLSAPLGPGDRVMAGLSVSFDASCEEMWLAWRYGATLVAAERSVVRSGDVLGEWLIDRDISVVSTVPTLASFWRPESLEKVRLLIFGGEACPLPLVAKLTHPGREIWNTYGPTETTVIVSGELMDDQPPVRIGRPIPGWELVVVDSDGQPVAWGDTGELIVGGIGLGRYLDPIKDAEVYAPLPSMGWDRAYRTGDIVRADKEGMVFIGRADDQIKFGGRRIELGELDDALTNATGVSSGAAALHKTAADSDVLVGYLVSEDGEPLDLQAIRQELGSVLPAGITPVLHQLEEMPMKTSGKVDRKALPWPLPSDSTGTSDIPEQLKWLAQRWADQLGPVPLTTASDFFDLGGSSVAVAKLVTELRERYPGADIAELYNNRTLGEMGAYLETLSSSRVERPLPEPLPWYSGYIQSAFIAGLYMINGLKYVTGSLLVVLLLSVVLEAAWVPRPPAIPIIAAWLFVFSIPGRIIQATVGVRLLTRGLRPGAYRRGGLTHLRVWAAERLLTFQNLDYVLGTPTAPLLYRLLGNRVGKDCVLSTQPPVTGLLTVGDNVSVESEVDIDGHWIEGDVFHIGAITIESDARVGTRTFVCPGVTIHEGAEILPGARVDRAVPAQELWGGSPLVMYGQAGQNWPASAPAEQMGAFDFRILSWLGLAWIKILPLLSIIPGVFMIFEMVMYTRSFNDVFPVLMAWAPAFVLLTMLTWVSLVITTVRAMSAWITPGFYPQRSLPAWAVWMTQALMERTLISTYFLYASWCTPTLLRLMGAKVGKDTEISTIVTIPHLTWIQDRSFVADHALASAPRHRQGWMHVGTTVIGEGSFVGNSGIVGPDRDLPRDSLVAVLSTAPYHPRSGTTWLGRPPMDIPRQRIESDTAVTYRPPQRLKLARAAVELLRMAPAVIAAWIDVTIIYVLTQIYMHGVAADDRAYGLLLAALWAGPVVLCGGIVASLIPIIAKWLLVGRFRTEQKALFSSFVWRSELADNISEPLAVPSLVRMSLGSPVFNLWARAMGTRIGRHAWVESWWLPEFDLITIGDHATVNRGTVVQTHLFHDRVMSLEPVTLHAGSTLGPNSFLLPGSSVGECSTIGPASLVLRGDSIPAHTDWEGNPAQMVPTSPHPSASA
ncbi:MAG: AMP-binding protein [Corynebacterium sp.]|uniref:Pls/PosA family non-ribosomal peptide synthetase n=1 Tax=Corynebacterium sp. TaxID=1720 RepID=UPI0026E0C6D0|nr:Pls/PosA family non-ribosomal peptide synthetase [Corynebacterium sp.]MDO5669129.1 AMP-binding protein [Corynebacterium sp.]